MTIGRDIKRANLIQNWPNKTHNQHGVSLNQHVTPLIELKDGSELIRHNFAMEKLPTCPAMPASIHKNLSCGEAKLRINKSSKS